MRCRFSCIAYLAPAKLNGGKMSYRAIIFDLFGTLVGNFSRREHDKRLAQIAEILNAPYPQFGHFMGETYADRCLGRYACFEELARGLCATLGIEAEMAQLSDAATIHDAFIANTLIPESEVLDVLDTLRNDGFAIGLISDCVPPVPRFFPQSPLAERIDAAVFSCDVQLKKPARRIYQLACAQLQVRPEECLYVGDGSSEELSGAAAAGMFPILKRTDLTDVYDWHRPEVDNWQGLVIDELRELCGIVR